MPFLSDTDRDWETWGKTDAYYSVLSFPQFHKDVLDDSALKEFFRSGDRHVEHVLSVLRQRFQANFEPSRILDYGCGVGRLVIPFAKSSNRVTGVDISPTMLEKAAQNAAAQGTGNIDFLLASDLSSIAPESFDLIHSFIVFQHIYPSRGETILRELLQKLKPGGLGAIHLTFHRDASLARRLVSSVRRRSMFAHRLANVLQGRSWSEPAIHMNPYSLNRIFALLYKAGCGMIFTEFSYHGDFLGAMIYFEKTQPALL